MKADGEVNQILPICVKCFLGKRQLSTWKGENIDGVFHHCCVHTTLMPIHYSLFKRWVLVWFLGLSLILENWYPKLNICMFAICILYIYQFACFGFGNLFVGYVLSAMPT